MQCKLLYSTSLNCTDPVEKMPCHREAESRGDPKEVQGSHCSLWDSFAPLGLRRTGKSSLRAERSSLKEFQGAH